MSIVSKCVNFYRKVVEHGHTRVTMAHLPAHRHQ